MSVLPLENEIPVGRILFSPLENITPVNKILVSPLETKIHI